MWGRANRTMWSVALVLLAGCSAAEPPAARPTAVILAAPEPTPEPAPLWIRVQKRARTLSVFEGPRLVKTYPVVLGKDPYWAKLYRGDHRTPEGEYHISNKYFHPFWSRFMLLDYPTPTNLEIYAWSSERALIPRSRQGEPGPGGAVGIHGTEDERLNLRGVDWTEGCISLLNADIEELYQLVPLGTRVVIER